MSECCVAVHGAAVRGSYARPFAAGAFLTTAPTPAAFGLLGIYNYTIYPFFPLPLFLNQWVCLNCAIFFDTIPFVSFVELMGMWEIGDKN